MMLTTKDGKNLTEENGETISYGKIKEAAPYSELHPIC